MNKTFYKIVCMAGLVSGLTSCSDFLEVEPQNEILDENFWNEQSDVDDMLFGCYQALQSEGAVKRMMVWGEFRSDNVTSGYDVYKDNSLENVFKENIKATNGYTTYADFYNVINRCNLIVERAPAVAAQDPGFSDSELKATIAEASALRDLCYFYLIRAFRNVPYTTKAYTEDSQEMVLAATPFDEVLDSLITDLERVKGDAIRKYPETQPLYQTGRITQMAIDAMLCEMYLWKQDYAQCINYADLVIDAKKQDEEDKKNQSSSLSGSTKNPFGFPLVYSNSLEVNNGGGGYGAYTQIFGEGNSSEGILELTYMKDDENSPSNGAVNIFYGNAKISYGYAKPSTFLGEDIKTKSYQVFNNVYDARFFENMNGSGLGIDKLTRSSYNVEKVTADGSWSWSGNSGMYAENKNKTNWVVYRLTDIMLLKAEALVETMPDVTDETTDNEAVEATRNEVFTIVNAINKRSMCQTPLKDTLKYSDYKNKAALEELVLLERQRELMFEGKRWFDLVRHTLRDNNTSVLTSKVLQKYTSNTSAIRTKFNKVDAVFWPYNRDELKVNTLLVQNPAYGTGDEEGSYEKTN